MTTALTKYSTRTLTALYVRLAHRAGHDTRWTAGDTARLNECRAALAERGVALSVLDRRAA